MNLNQIKDQCNINIKYIKCIYVGRFQFFGKHHFKVWEYLTNIFGDGNVYIGTTDKVEYPDSPLNFSQKKLIIEQYGIPSNRIYKVKTPYGPKEITDNFNLDSTAVFLAIGEKDSDRIDYVKKDGTATYIQKFNSSTIVEPITKHQYTIIIPTFNINIPGYGVMSGTTLRKFVLEASPNFFKETLGWYDKNIFNMLRNSIKNIQETTKLIDCVPSQSYPPIFLI